MTNIQHALCRPTPQHPAIERLHHVLHHLQHVCKLVLRQRHEHADLLATAAIVVNGEGIDADVSHAQFQAPLKRINETAVAMRMAINLAHAMSLGKAPVAIHHKSNVVGYGTAGRRKHCCHHAPRPAPQSVPQPRCFHHHSWWGAAVH